MSKEEIEKKIFEEFQESWSAYPSQDNEGYQPERGSYKAGYFVGVRFGTKLLLEILRSPEALAARRKFLMQGEIANTNEWWADWLEEQLK